MKRGSVAGSGYDEVKSGDMYRPVEE